MVSGSPDIIGNALICSLILPLATTAGMRSQRSIQTFPGERARVIRDSEISGEKNPWRDDRWPSFHPVDGPRASARNNTLRAGAPRAAASTSVSRGIRDSLLILVFGACFSNGSVYSKSVIVLRSCCSIAKAERGSTFWSLVRLVD